ncbi:MAG: hypothetical protein WCP31_05700 [Chloroflexales bacterium]
MATQTRASRRMRLGVIVGCLIATALATILAGLPTAYGATGPYRVYLPQIKKSLKPRLVFTDASGLLNGSGLSTYSSINLDGSGLTQIIGSEYPVPHDSSWSPNGRTLAMLESFTVAGISHPTLWVMDVGTFARKRLTDDTLSVSMIYDYSSSFAAWSPDSSKLVFAASPVNGGNIDLYTINANGSELTQLTNDAVNEASPAWSPDGQRIAFSASTPISTSLMLINTDGTGQHSLISNNTNTPPTLFHPSWSPDGRWIAYLSQPIEAMQLVLIRPDGTGQQQVGTKLASTQFSWAPDGRWLAVYQCVPSLTCANAEVAAVSAEGEATRVLVPAGTWDTVTALYPAWSPVGDVIALGLGNSVHTFFYSSLWVVGSDGTGLRELTPGWMPVWLP